MKIKTNKKYSENDLLFFFKNTEEFLTIEDIIDCIGEDLCKDNIPESFSFIFQFQGKWSLNEKGEEIFLYTINCENLFYSVSLRKEKEDQFKDRVLKSLLKGIESAEVEIAGVKYKRPILYIEFSKNFCH